MNFIFDNQTECVEILFLSTLLVYSRIHTKQLLFVYRIPDYFHVLEVLIILNDPK